jgi:hypothetical protein
MITQTQITGISTKLMSLDQTKLNSLSELEVLAGRTARQVIRVIIAQWLEACEDHEPPPQTRCRECGLHANFVSMKGAFARTQFGLVRYQRAYYVCPHCHASTCPLDERINPVASLARLRAKIAAGKTLPVAEMANAWGLGSLKRMTSVPSATRQDALQYSRSSTREMQNVVQPIIMS